MEEARADEKRRQRSADEPENDFIVESENWLAWCIFRDCATQWRYGFAGATGLDYSAVIAVMEVSGVHDKRGTLNRVKLMETGAMAGFRGKAREELWPDS